MADKWHLQWLKEGAASWNARRDDVQFKPDFTEADLTEFSNAGTSKIKPGFDGYDFRDANFESAKITGLSFRGSRFTRANFRSVKAAEADFTTAKLYSTNWQHAEISGCNFSFSQLRNADFTSASRKGAIFLGANVEEAFGLRGVPGNSIEGGIRSAEKPLTDISRDLAFFKRFPRSISRKISTTNPIDQNEPSPPLSVQDTYRVYYATNREAVLSNDKNRVAGYSHLAAKKTNYGTAEIVVPKAHMIGSMGSPWWKRLFNGDDRLSISGFSTLSDELYFEHIRRVFRGSQETATYFIHGYNTSFEEALLRAGQIGFDLSLSNGIGLFSWPSKGEIKDYTVDERAMEQSKYAVAQFIEDLAASLKGQKINFIAHSMGCRCFASAMEVLHLRCSPALASIDKVILAAADIDQAIMKDMGEAITMHAEMSTSYVCSKDLALQASGAVHAGARVGFYPPPFTMDNLDTVQVNKSRLESFGHAYVADNEDLIGDMFSILKNSLRPTHRHRLERIGDPILSHWRMKK
jgi:esterase/lipase superfamily enzyme